MAKKLSVLGIRSVPLEPRPGELVFFFKVAKGSPADPLFYSNPMLRSLLAKKSQIGHNLGHLTYFFDSADAEPTKALESIQTFNSANYARNGLLGKGIASTLEKKCLVEAQKRFGKFRVEPFMSSSKERRKQILARGIKLVDKNPAYSVSSTRMLQGINTVRRRMHRRFNRK